MNATQPNPEAQTAILDAAEALFARKGFRATTIKEIGRDSGTNPALLYYYFGNKEGLHRAVLDRLFSPFLTAGGTLLRGAEPEEGIRRLVELQAEYLGAHPTMPKLIVRELLDNRLPSAHPLVPRQAAATFGALVGLIEEGQRQGAFRADLDPRLAAISTIAQVIYVFIARPLLDVLLGVEEGGPSPLTTFGPHAAEFALSALRVPAPKDA